MYDPLRTEFRFACPTRGQAAARLSAFRRLERLPGASHPAVFEVHFECSCGANTWPRLGHRAGLGAARARRRRVPQPHDGSARRVGAGARRRGRTQDRSGEWPWSFFCYPEGPATSGLSVVVHAPRPGTARLDRPARPLSDLQRLPSLNLVSGARRRAVPQRPRGRDRRARLRDRCRPRGRALHAELYSSRFDARRLGL